jgi:hypothetical protein
MRADVRAAMSTTSVKAIRSAAAANAQAARQLVESIVAEKGPLSVHEIYDETHRTHITPPYPHSLLPSHEPQTPAPHPDHLIKSIKYLKMVLKTLQTEGDLVQSTASRWKRMQGGEANPARSRAKDQKFVWIPKPDWEKVWAVHQVQLAEEEKQKEERRAAASQPRQQGPTSMETAAAAAAAAAS